MWSLGKVVQTPEVARVYIGSFWDRPLHFDENRKLFEAEQDDLFADIQSLPRTAAVRKVNELIKRARLAKVHAFILYQLRSEMPSWFGQQSKKAELIANLANIFFAIQKQKQLPVGDFPNVKRMQTQLEEYDFKSFPKLNLTLVEDVDSLLAEDITRVLKLIPREEQVAKDYRIKGGAFGSGGTDPFSNDYSMSRNAANDDDGWLVSSEITKYDVIFQRLGPNAHGKISGSTAREEMIKSKLPNSVLRRIWNFGRH